MAYHKSAEKRHRQSTKRNARNVAMKSAVRTALRKAREAAESGDAKEAAAAIQAAQVELARAGTKGAFHKRNVSRRVGRLAVLQNQVAAGTQKKAETGASHKAARAKAAKAKAQKAAAAAKK